MERAYSVKRIAEMCDMEPKQIYRLIHEDKLKAFPIGKRGLRVTEGELMRWQNQSVKATPTEALPSENETAKQLPTFGMKIISEDA